MTNKVQIPLIFFLKNIFDQSGAIEPRIKNVLEIGSTDWKELKKARVLALKTRFFDQSKNRFDRSNPEKSENFENLEIFCKSTFKPVFIWYEMHTNDPKCF